MQEIKEETQQTRGSSNIPINIRRWKFTKLLELLLFVFIDIVNLCVKLHTQLVEFCLSRLIQIKFWLDSWGFHRMSPSLFSSQTSNQRKSDQYDVDWIKRRQKEKEKQPNNWINAIEFWVLNHGVLALISPDYSRNKSRKYEEKRQTFTKIK